MPGKVPKFKAEQCLALQDEHAVGMLKRKLLDKSNDDQPLWSTVADRIDLCRHDDASQVLRRVVEEASNRSIFPLGDRRRQHTIPIAGEKPPVQSSSGYAGSSGWGSTPSSQPKADVQWSQGDRVIEPVSKREGVVLSYDSTKALVRFVECGEVKSIEGGDLDALDREAS